MPPHATHPDGDLPSFDESDSTRFDRPRVCFGCGLENPAGLQLTVACSIEQERARTHFTPKPVHEGPPGLVHGGIVMTALDETMAWLATILGDAPCLTGNLAVKLRQPLPVDGGPYTVEAGVIRRSSGRFKLQGTLLLADDTTLAAEAEGLFVSITPEQWHRHQ